MVISIRFLLHSNLDLSDSLANNIKTIFLQHENLLQKASTKFTLITMGSKSLSAATSHGNIKGSSHLPVHVSDE